MNSYTEVDEYGNKFWYNENGEYHRLDGPAVECANGYKMWCQNDQRHRLDGPAVEWPDGTKMWYQNGLYHRLDGPALEWADGDKEWCIEGETYTEEEFQAKIAEMI